MCARAYPQDNACNVVSAAGDARVASFPVKELYYTPTWWRHYSSTHFNGRYGMFPTRCGSAVTFRTIGHSHSYCSNTRTHARKYTHTHARRHPLTRTRTRTHTHTHTHVV